MKISQIILFLCLIANVSCGKLFENDTQNHYTISGRLFKGVSDEPFANQPLKLTGQYREVTELKFVDLGTATTDANGFFSIRYKPIRQVQKETNTESTSIALEFDNTTYFTPILYYPWNKDVERDVAQFNHSRVMIVPSFSDPNSDSLFLSIADIIPENEFIVKRYFEEVDHSYFIYAAKRSDVEKFILLKSGFAGPSDKSVVAYGTTFEEFRKAHLATIFDSLSLDYQRVKYSITGFPNVDTVKFIVE